MQTSRRNMIRQFLQSARLAVLPVLTVATALPAQTVATQIDSVRREVIITVSGFDVPPMSMGAMPQMDHEMKMEHDHHDGPLTLYRFDWPVNGYGKAFHIEVRDGKGALLPRSLLHHVIGINLDRRQFVYAATERLFAIGRETEAVTLPGALAIPLDQGQRLGFYVAWHNDTGHELRNLSVRIVMNWVPASAARQLIAVLPVYLDVNNDIGGDNTFDVIPGKSSKAFEFSSPVSGKLLAVGGHLHDYGAAIRLDDAATGATLVRLAAAREKDGRIKAMPRKFFAFNPIRLQAGHRYRVVAEYDSPLARTIPDGAMGNLVGAIAPDDPGRWPVIDPSDPMFRKDVQSLGVPGWVPAARRPRSDGANR